MYICVDFDGTIVDHCFPEVGEVVPGAIEWMKKWQAAGGKIIIWTVRSNQLPHMSGTWEDTAAPPRQYQDEARDLVLSHGVDLFGVNENPHQKSWSISPKAYAPIYVDDAALGAPLIEIEGFRNPCIDWDIAGPHVMKMIEERR